MCQVTFNLYLNTPANLSAGELLYPIIFKRTVWCALCHCQCGYKCQEKYYFVKMEKDEENVYIKKKEIENVLVRFTQ